MSFQIIVILKSSHTQKARKLGARDCHICTFKSKTILTIIFDLYLGGKMNFILIGGAPLSQTTHDFIRVCLGSIVVQGYSLTESTCTGTVMENCDLTSNTVGAPMTGKFIFVCLFVFVYLILKCKCGSLWHPIFSLFGYGSYLE